MEKTPSNRNSIIPDSLNPNKIIEQAGKDAGRIADKNFAHAIAIEINRHRNYSGEDKKSITTNPEALAMQQELYKRIKSEVGPADPKLKWMILQIVTQKIKQNMREHAVDRNKLADDYAKRLLDEFSHDS